MQSPGDRTGNNTVHPCFKRNDILVRDVDVNPSGSRYVLSSGDEFSEEK